SATDAGAYCVVVNGFCNSAISCASLTVNVPTTASGPVDLTRCPGQSAAFSTIASGTGPFSYQWRKGGVDITGATADTFSIASVTAADAGIYCVVVTGKCSSVTKCATLTVNTLTTSSGLSNLTLCPG